MAKDAYYFLHDSNAHNDQKMLQLRLKYGYEGYGLFWVIVEFMRDESSYKLNLNGIEALSIAINYDSKKLKQFIDDCINNFKLFSSDGDNYYSNRLLSNMKRKEQISKKMRANAKQKHSKSKTIGVIKKGEYSIVDKSISDNIITRWNEATENTSIPKIKALSPKRINAVKIREKETGVNFDVVIDEIKQSDFLRGKKPDSDFILTFDWVFLPTNYSKIIEGNYRNRKSLTTEQPKFLNL